MKKLILIVALILSFGFAQDTTSTSIPDTVITKRLVELEAQFNTNKKQIEQLQLENKLIANSFIELQALLNPKKEDTEE